MDTDSRLLKMGHLNRDDTLFVRQGMDMYKLLALIFIALPSPSPPATSTMPPISLQSRVEDLTPPDQEIQPFRRPERYIKRLMDLFRRLLVLPSIQAVLRKCAIFTRNPLLHSSNTITLIDALSRTKILPYEYFSNRKLLQTWLEEAFCDMPETTVDNGAYALFKQHSSRAGPEVPFSAWKSMVLPGDRVIMSILTGPHCNNDRARLDNNISENVTGAMLHSLRQRMRINGLNGMPILLFRGS